MIDLRSDTVTRPSEAMRRAMAAAEVGDDWFGDDPTVNRLQERAAEIVGMEAALFVASGTMANQLALRCLVRLGHEYVAEATAHVATMELASAASNSGIVPRPIAANGEPLTGEMVAAALEPVPYNLRVADIVCVENTHQVSGGRVLPLENLRAIRKAATEAGVPLYLDGARIFNASAAARVDVAEWAGEADAMMFSLSKGLGAPVGSLLCGPADLIAEARRQRIHLGGAWRQAGILAAAGLLALEEGPKRLHEDHELAQRLAEGIADVYPGAIDPAGVETNIVFVEPAAVGLPLEEIMGRLEATGVLVSTVAGRVRMVTHLDVSSEDIENALTAWRALGASA